MLSFPAPTGRRFGWLLRGAGVLLAGGCAFGPGALGPGMEAPSINLSRIRLQDSTVLEQRFLAVLRVQKPNAVDLAIEGIAYDLEVNGQPFAKGVGKGLVIIPAFSQGTMETEAITTLTGFIRQLREVGRARRPPIAYRLTGKVKLQDHPSALSFEMRGDYLWSTRVSDTPPPEPTAGGGQPEHP
jgi:LEA14-like dessication related protein